MWVFILVGGGPHGTACSTGELGHGPHQILQKPGDYQESMKVAGMKTFQRMHAEEPATYELVDGVKYGPNKSDVVEVWDNTRTIDWEEVANKTLKVDEKALAGKKKKQKKKTKKNKNKKKNKEKKTVMKSFKKKTFSLEARQERLRHVMHAVAMRLDKKDISVWLDSCGRFVT
jgi:hypothetical protein